MGEVLRHERYTRWGTSMRTLPTATNFLDIEEKESALR